MTTPLRKNTVTKVLMHIVELDGVTPISSGVGYNAIGLSKNGSAISSKHDATAPVYLASGWWSIQLDDTDTNTLGDLLVQFWQPPNGIAPLHSWVRCKVLTQSKYDGIYGDDTNKLETDIVKINGSLTDGTPANNDRPQLFLNRLSLEIDNDNLSALDIRNVSNNATHPAFNVESYGSIGLLVIGKQAGIKVQGTNGKDIDFKEIDDINNKIGTPQDLGTGDTIADNEKDNFDKTLSGTVDANVIKINDKLIDGSNTVDNRAKIYLNSLQMESNDENAVKVVSHNQQKPSFKIDQTAENSVALEITGAENCRGAFISGAGASGVGIHASGQYADILAKEFNSVTVNGEVDANVKKVNDVNVSSVNDFKADVTDMETQTHANTNRDIITSTEGEHFEYLDAHLTAQDVEIMKIVNKLPIGNLSDLRLDNVVDGVPLYKIFEFLMSMFNGRYKVDTPNDGQITYYKRDNSSVLSTVTVTDEQRTRDV